MGDEETAALPKAASESFRLVQGNGSAGAYTAPSYPLKALLCRRHPVRRLSRRGNDAFPAEGHLGLNVEVVP